MTPPATLASPDAVIYPDSDGKRTAENTLQYEWIVAIHGNLERQFRNDPDAFVAADNLIYPVQGNARISSAPDVYVAFGRPKGHRGSYKVWEEDGVFPQVVFEVWSPGNTLTEMIEERGFYRRHGAEEFYLIDPDTGQAEAWVREAQRLVPVEDVAAFVSPRLGIRFDPVEDGISLIGPDGRRFLNFLELGELVDTEREHAEQERQRAEWEKQRADAERQRADTERARAEVEKSQAEQEKRRADKLAAKLRELGLDPDAV